MSVLKTVKKMSVLDVTLYKLAVYAFGLLLAMSFPWFQTVDPIIYVIIAAVLITYLVYKTHKKRKKPLGFMDNALANFHDYSLRDMAAFEIGLTVLGIIFYIYIPRFSTVDPVRYVAILFFGSGWILGMRMHQK